MLNTSHVMQDISVDQFDDVVANIFVSMYLGFNEADLTAEGKNHNKSLHIFYNLCRHSNLEGPS